MELFLQNCTAKIGFYLELTNENSLFLKKNKADEAYKQSIKTLFPK